MMQACTHSHSKGLDKTILDERICPDYFQEEETSLCQTISPQTKRL